MKKKTIISAVVILAAILCMACLLTGLEYRSYTKRYNEKLNSLALLIKDKYPQVSDQEIIELINAPAEKQGNFFIKYGVDLEKNSVIPENERSYKFFLGINLATVIAACGIFAGIFHLQHRKRQKTLAKIAEYLSNINSGNYKFDMEDSEEGELSLLESEVYKTTIMLKEASDNSRLEKQRLKDSLSDISHQLKTPLTSLVINLDNLKENPGLDEAYRSKLVSRIRRDVNKISQMVQQLLTLSKIDADVIEFKKNQTSLKEIVDESLKNVETLSDLKGIPVTLERVEDSEAVITCDSYWEVQAISNLIKNAIEHAQTKVTVRFLNCELYKEIVVENDGDPISETERKNIFNRFYSGEHSTKDSVGIGLSIANAVILKDGGYILVDSDENLPGSGVRFIVRYV